MTLGGTRNFDKGSKPIARSISREPICINFDTIKPYFMLPQKLAAAHLGLSLTALKSVCRKLGISKWAQVRANETMRVTEEAGSGPQVAAGHLKERRIEKPAFVASPLPLQSSSDACCKPYELYSKSSSRCSAPDCVKPQANLASQSLDLISRICQDTDESEPLPHEGFIDLNYDVRETNTSAPHMLQDAQHQHFSQQFSRGRFYPVNSANAEPFTPHTEYSRYAYVPDLQASQGHTSFHQAPCTDIMIAYDSSSYDLCYVESSDDLSYLAMGRGGHWIQ